MADAQFTMVVVGLAALAFIVAFARAIGSSERIVIALVFGVPMVGLVAIPRDLFDDPWLTLFGLIGATAVAFVFDQVLTVVFGKVARVMAWFGWALLTLTLLFLLWWLLALALVLVVLFALCLFGYAIVRIRRLRMADTISPDGVQLKVALGGTVQGPLAAPPPGAQLDTAAWWVAEVGEDKFVSGLLHLDSPSGPVLVEGAELTLDFKTEHMCWPNYTDERKLLMDFGLTEQQASRNSAGAAKQPVAADQDPPEQDGEKSYTLNWLAQGESVYVIGVPDWDRGPAELGGYRDAPVVPVFRHVRVVPHLVDRPIVQARRDAYYDAIALMITTIAVTTVVGYFHYVDLW